MEGLMFFSCFFVVALVIGFLLVPLAKRYGLRVRAKDWSALKGFSLLVLLLLIACVLGGLAISGMFGGGQLMGAKFPTIGFLFVLSPFVLMRFLMAIREG